MSTEESSKDVELDQLAALQDIDRELKVQQDKVDELIGAADDCELKLAAQRAELERLTLEKKTLDSQRRDLEVRVEIEGNKIRDSRMKMNNVRTDREVLALQRQVEIGRAANQQLEEELFTVLESLETLEAQMAEIRTDVAELGGKANTEAVERRREAEGLDRDLESVRTRRHSIADKINPSLRSKYEQLFKVRNGTAVVEVRQGTCLGCHMNVPPQLFNEIQRDRNVRQCPNCNRILFWRPADPNGSGAEA